MQFIIRIMSYGATSPIDINIYRGGLNLLDRAREFVGIPNLLPESVDDCTYGFREMIVDIEIDEDTARKSNLFSESSIAKVMVPSHSLEKYLDTKPYLDQQDGRIMVRWKLFLDTKRVVEEWIAAGCPAEWNPRARKT